MSRSALIFQPSPVSYGFSGFWNSGPEEVEAAAEGRVPHGQSMIDAVERVNITLSAGVLESLNGLKDSDLMASVATADSAAQLKASYWLHVAARSFQPFSDPRERLESKADGLYDRGEAGIEQEGSAARISNITKTYADAARALRSELDAAGGGSPVQQQVYSVLAKGASADEVSKAISIAKKQRQIVVDDAAARDEDANGESKPCSETWKGYIPGVCGLEATGKVLVYGGLGVAALTGIYLIYRQVSK